VYAWSNDGAGSLHGAPDPGTDELVVARWRSALPSLAGLRPADRAPRPQARYPCGDPL